MLQAQTGCWRAVTVPGLTSPGPQWASPGRAGTVPCRRRIKDPDYYQSPQYLQQHSCIYPGLKGQHLLEKPPKPMARQGQFYYLAG